MPIMCVHACMLEYCVGVCVVIVIQGVENIVAMQLIAQHITDQLHEVSTFVVISLMNLQCSVCTAWLQYSVSVTHEPS